MTEDFDKAITEAKKAIGYPGSVNEEDRTNTKAVIKAVLDINDTKPKIGIMFTGMFAPLQIEAFEMGYQAAFNEIRKMAGIEEVEIECQPPS